MLRLALLVAAGSLTAQDTTFRTTVPVIMAPATVTDARGKYIDGLGVEDFALLDDGHPRRIQLETSDSVAIPLSVVVVVQANSTAPAAIRKIQKIGSMIEPLITGERGHAALIAFGSEVKLVQDFSRDPDKLILAFRAIQAQRGTTATMIDAVAEAARMLSSRPNNERRVIFVIGESRDRGSRTRLNDAIKAVQLAGAIVYPVTFSAYVTQFTTKPSEHPPAEGGGGLDLLGPIAEFIRLGKTDASQVLAGYSGGRRASFTTLHGLEQVVTGLGEELHSQYILSYTNETCLPGLHKIEIRVKTRSNAIVRARYGYWADEESCRPAAR